VPVFLLIICATPITILSRFKIGIQHIECVLYPVLLSTSLLNLGSYLKKKRELEREKKRKKFIFKIALSIHQ